MVAPQLDQGGNIVCQHQQSVQSVLIGHKTGLQIITAPKKSHT